MRRRGEEPVGRAVEVERRPDEQQLGERPRMEGDGDLARAPARRRGRASRRLPARGTSVAGVAATRSARAGQLGRFGGPREAEAGEPRQRLGRRRRLDLRRGQEVGERVEVVADADPALGRGLERRRATAGEWVEDDVAAAASSGR